MKGWCAISRGQQGQVFNQSQAENSSYNTNAQDAFKTSEGDVGNYASAVGKFAAANPYTQGGTVQTANNQETADAAAGAAQSYGGALQGQAVRTGQNAGGAIAATEQMAENNERNLVGQEAAQNKDLAAANAGYGQTVLGATGNVESMQDKLAAEQAQAAQGALGSEEEAAKTPGFLDQLTGELISAGGQVGAAFCPAEGSMYLMADGSERRVEELEVGDMLMGIDGEPQLIEEIHSSPTAILRVTTADGFISRSSRVHAFAQPIGGFVVAVHAMGKTVLTASGRSRVVAVEWDGEARVYNVITDGSHTYRADGIWALGVGEAERQVPMETWDKIGDRLIEKAVNDGR